MNNTATLSCYTMEIVFSVESWQLAIGFLVLMWNETKERIKKLAHEAGFDLCGVAPARDFAELKYFPRWIAEGRHGEMSYLAATAENQQLKRQSLANVAPWARSVIVCAIDYNTTQPYSTDCLDSTHGWISRYAWAEIDYHTTVLQRLRKLESDVIALAANRQTEPLNTWCYVDTGPVVERVLARYAGIGWIGKNTCVINQQLGSWIFLAVLLTSLPLPPDLPAPDRCGTCTRCLDACPTQALPAPYQMDASRCIAYLTIEKHGNIPADLRAGIGRNVFGCDICQDVCPWNRQAVSSSASEFAPRTELVNPELRRLAAMSPEEFRAIFRHSPVKRAKYQGLMRNVIIAMGNSRNPLFIPELERWTQSDDVVLREYAKWSLSAIACSAADVKKII